MWQIGIFSVPIYLPLAYPVTIFLKRIRKKYIINLWKVCAFLILHKEFFMKKVALLLVACALMAACSGTRGKIGNQKVCTNDYLLGVISISELVSPCGK